MKILIVGAGVVGFNLASELSQEGHDICIIDNDADKIKVISDKLDVLAIQGNACLPTVLVKAGIEDTEMLIAVTNKDEINIFVCMLADKFRVKKRFTRLRELEFTGRGQVFQPHELFIDQAINPGQIIIDFVVKILKTPGAVNVAEFADGQILLRGFDVQEDAPLAGKKIEAVRPIAEMNSFLIVALVREGKIIIPKNDDEIRAGDKVYLLAAKEFLPLIVPMLNKRAEEIQKIIIFGANPVTINLAKSLEEWIPDLSIIEPQIEKADWAVDELSKTMVLHGTATDPDLYKEINMHDADFFMALTENDEHNILSAMLAKKRGAKRVMVICNDPFYLPILDSIGMDIAINPRLITVGAILKHLRRGMVRSVYKLVENDAEVLEIVINPKSATVGKKIEKINFPEDAMIGAILRNGEMIVPEPCTQIEAGDSVIVVALPKSIEKIEKLFGKRRIF